MDSGQPPSASHNTGNADPRISELPRPEGYDRLGMMMGYIPEAAVFRRFSALSAEDLLYRQAELQELEITLRWYQKNDKESGNEHREIYARDWDTLQRSCANDATEGNDSAQWKCILNIRQKLKDYQDALLRHRQVLALGSPIPRNVTALNDWMERTDSGNVYLLGADRNIWRDPTMVEDLVPLAVPSEDRSLDNEFITRLIYRYNHLIGRHIHVSIALHQSMLELTRGTLAWKKPNGPEFLPNTITYNDQSIFRTFRVISTIIASLLPIVGIHVLYHIQSMGGRMGAVSGLTAAFSFALSFFTSAHIKDIFAATAAFAAVLVVFVGTSEIAPGPSGNGITSNSTS